MRLAIVAGHAIHGLDLVGVLLGKVRRQIRIHVGVHVHFAGLGIVDTHPRDLLLEMGIIGGNVFDVVFDVPVNALAPAFAMGAAAGVKGHVHQRHFVVLLRIIGAELADFVVRELLRVVTLFADLAGRSQ
ncbi:MAG: hypothetical protein R2838_02160 [Caldilineaceae bacterium]